MSWVLSSRRSTGTAVTGSAKYEGGEAKGAAGEEGLVEEGVLLSATFSNTTRRKGTSPGAAGRMPGVPDDCAVVECAVVEGAVVECAGADPACADAAGAASAGVNAARAEGSRR